ncbi:MAG: HEAT repeat domain-containing protein [Planctomycetes bacterium]|nr:HEAT repeat domain-containing protein [Planctomycetota bacterium]
MKKILTAGALIALASLTLQDFSYGHGGTYRGPGDTVPPGPGGGGGGGGPATPGPGGPSTPGPTGPGTPGPSTPGQPGTGQPGSRPTTGPAASGPDLTTWHYWWGFNKEPYLNLKEHINTGTVTTGSDEFFKGTGKSGGSKQVLRPSETTIRTQVVPAMIRALETERSNHIITGALVALAKIGDAKNESGKSEMFEKIRPFLAAKGEAEIGETAAVALGILANDSPEIVDLLIALLEDKAADIRGKYKDVQFENEVPMRTRAFAGYGLGLIGYRSTDIARKQQINGALVGMLDKSKRMGTRDIPVACLTSIGLVPLEFDANDDALSAGRQTQIKTRNDQLRFLLEYYKDENQEYLNRAHAPTAMARLLTAEPAVPGTSKLRGEVVKLLTSEVAKGTKAKDEEKQSCMLALGQIGDCDNDAWDIEIRKAVLGAGEVIKDQQTQYFSMIAAGQIGGRPGTGEGDPVAGIKDVRKTLTELLNKGKSAEKSWAGLAIGVMERGLEDNKMKSACSPDMAKAVSNALADARSPVEIGAYAISLGLMKDLDSKLVLTEKFNKVSDADAQGYCAVGLGLMNSSDAIKPIQDVIRKSTYKPELLRSAAIGLGLLGDKTIVPELIDMLGRAGAQSSQAAIASALGFIGDTRSVEPLLKFIEDKEKTDGARGFAAAALGIVADKEPLPWNSKISVDINYRANTPSLTSPDAGTGILDIL